MTEPFPRVRWRHKGYHRGQVEAFLNQVEVSLSGALPSMSSTEIRQAGFEMVHGGYDASAVDRALDEFEERVLALQDVGGGRRGRVDTAGEVEYLTDELTAPYMKRFRRVSALRRGYDVDSVDDMLDRVVAAFRGDAALTVDEVRGSRFPPRRGGYDEDAVDETLDRVIELLLMLKHEAARQQDAQP